METPRRASHCAPAHTWPCRGGPQPRAGDTCLSRQEEKTMQQTIETGQTGEIGQAGQAGDTTVRVLRAPMREIGMAWTSDGRTVSVLERQTSLVAARHAADRR